jgi:hypothetical protein
MRIITATLPSVLAALVLAACGSDGGSGSGAPAAASPGDKAFEGALRFARCMRGEGLDFPDPEKGPNGLIKLRGPRAAGKSPDDPRLQVAHEKCRRHLQQGGGEAPDAAQQAKFQDAFLEYARCMRREGIDVPDPKPGEGGLVLKAGDADAPDPESAAYRAADRKCHPALAEIDEAIREESR